MSCWLVLLSCIQFHFPFYMSRPLPNTFALASVLHGFALWLDGRHRGCLFVLVCTMTVFRSELLILAAPIALSGLIEYLRGVSDGIGLFEGIFYGIAAMVTALVVTTPIDSLFWQRGLWPEGEVLSLSPCECGIFLPVGFIAMLLCRCCISIPCSIRATNGV